MQEGRELKGRPGKQTSTFFPSAVSAWRKNLCPQCCFLSLFYWLCYYSFPIFSPIYPQSALHPSTHQHLLPFSSCQWVVYISSLASTFPILFLTSPCLFCAYHLYFLFPVPSPPFLPLATDNPPCDLYFHDSVPILVVCHVFVFRFSC